MDVEVQGFESEYGKTGALYLKEPMNLDNTKATAEIPATPLTYTVTVTDVGTADEPGKGQIKFSHAINMVWLEENFSDFFNAYVVANDKLDKKLEASDFKATKFDSAEDGMVVEFSLTGFKEEE